MPAAHCCLACATAGHPCKKRSREAADVAALVQEAGDMKIAEEKAKRRKLSKSRENIEDLV